MADKAWKAFERRVAKDVNGRRIPVTGLDRHGADVEDRMFDYQVKLRKSIPVWVRQWLDGIQGTASARGKTGVLVLKRPGERDEDAVVVLSWRDWVELHGTPHEGEEAR